MGGCYSCFHGLGRGAWRAHDAKRDQERVLDDLYAAVEASDAARVRRLLSERGSAARRAVLWGVRSEDCRTAPDLVAAPSLLSKSFAHRLESRAVEGGRGGGAVGHWARHAKFTPLHYAARNGDADVLEVLLSGVASCRKARGEFCDRVATIEDGQTALHLAVFAPQEGPRRGGAEACASSRYLARELSRIFRHGQRHRAVEVLLANGASVDAQGLIPMLGDVHAKGTALHMACVNFCDLDTMQLLLKYGSDVNARVNCPSHPLLHDCTPLHLCCLMGAFTPGPRIAL
eukprot:evm.model.scf_98.6 EVM.evm.TU.scf_98.6   scf_98:40446-41643(+)